MKTKTKVVQLPPPDEEYQISDDVVTVTELDEIEDTEDTGEGELLSAKAVATMLGTDGRTFRKFLRSERGKVGQGNRWAIDASEVEELGKRFAAFNKPKPTKEVKILLAPADVEVDEDLDDMLAEEIDDLDEIEIG